MMTYTGPGALSAMGVGAVKYPGLEREKAQKAAAGTKFDSVTVSAHGTEGKGSRFHMQLVGKLSQEVRTTTTTGTIRQLHQQVQDGTYVVDPATIARRMMMDCE